MSLFDIFWGLWPLLLAFTIWLTIHLGLDRLFPQLDFISNLFWTQAQIQSDLANTKDPPKHEELEEVSQQKSSQSLQRPTQIKPTGFFVQELKPKSLRSSYERSQEILDKQRNRALEKWPRLALRGNLDSLERKNARSRRSGSEPAISILPQIQALRARRALGSYKYRNVDSEAENQYFAAEELPEEASWPRSDEEQEENPEMSPKPSGSGLKFDPKSDFDSVCLRPADQCDYTCLHGPNCTELEIEPETSQDSQDEAEELLVEGIKALEEFYVDAPIERRRRPSIEEAIMEVKRCSRDLTDYLDQAVNQTQHSAKVKWQKSDEGKGERDESSLDSSRNLLNKKEAPPSTIKESSESSQTIDEQDGGSATADKALKHENTVVRVDTVAPKTPTVPTAAQLHLQQQQILGTALGQAVASNCLPGVTGSAAPSPAPPAQAQAAGSPRLPNAPLPLLPGLPLIHS
ncbi:calcium/calmodulin-dependent protein kinase type II [Ditylenchus destructor]|uniref:Calcium/calmodulin-dependent protein kinase type II n=1 Tax=Ditylenchus destructor TaxID=166010 RepID=A0AAD4MXQ7_9BILA|nr:calcium/calmodulin-dependent protein kinase type II [Ditylenchus destructor]